MTKYERLSDERLRHILAFGGMTPHEQEDAVIEIKTLRQDVAELRSGDDVVRDPRDPEIASVWSHAYWMERARNAERIISALNSVGPVMPETPSEEVLMAIDKIIGPSFGATCSMIHNAIRDALARGQGR